MQRVGHQCEKLCERMNGAREGPRRQNEFSQLLVVRYDVNSYYLKFEAIHPPQIP